MKALRSDNAKEFKKLQTTCESKYGVEFDSSIKHTPEQNGVAERMVRTLTERMRCMLEQFDLPEAMWAEAAMTAAHYVNIMPSSVRGMEVPYAVWHRHTPAYEKLRTFGGAVLSYVDKQDQQGLIQPYCRVYENKGGRLFADSALQPSDVTTKEYFGLDSSVEDSIEPMLDEMHEDSTDGDCSDGADCWTGGASDAKDGSDYRTSEADDTPHNDRSGGAIERVVRSGGASVCKKRKPRTDTAAPPQKRVRFAVSKGNRSSKVAERGQSGSDRSSKVAERDDERVDGHEADHLRGEYVSGNSRKKKKRKRSSGRCNAPAANEMETLPGRLAVDTKSSPERANSKSRVAGDTASEERLTTPTCRALREYTGPRGTRPNDRPVTRSGRVSKPPTWFGDYVYIAYENTNPDDDVSSLPDGWRKARAELQRAIANELILAWWEDYCCMATGEFTEPDTFSDANLKNQLSARFLMKSKTKSGSVANHFEAMRQCGGWCLSNNESK
ncbi:unnamed protein product [Phytophthora fragariaefolia]|uniref:Unnamed protein product n=1 Tax=Phytophthora fragariaefolia TaxID=1490495 RepID=A0A9W7D128_9STRA|nr:unnamed protein product [Phytophthora fragariaefolia]